MSQSVPLAHPSGLSYPDINVPLQDRCIAKLMGISVLEQIVRRTGLKPCLQSTFPSRESARILERISTERVLQLFAEDARNGSQLLLVLLLNKPNLLEQLLRPMGRQQRQWVLQLFGENPPHISEQAATSCGLLLTRLQDPRMITPVLTTLLRHASTPVKAAALHGLFEGGRLNFSQLMTLANGLAPASEEQPAAGQDVIVAALKQAREYENVRLMNHLHIYVALMYRSLPRYQEYWAQCTGLPQSSCPVGGDPDALRAGLGLLSQTLVTRLYSALNEDALLSLTAHLGWRKIQPKSAATLRNPGPAIGDFIFRTFSSLLPIMDSQQSAPESEVEQEPPVAVTAKAPQESLHHLHY